MSKAAKYLIILGYCYECYSGARDRKWRKMNLDMRRMIASNLIAGNY